MLNTKIPNDVIVIGATKGNSLISKCIKFFQQYPFTHVFYVKGIYCSPKDNDLVTLNIEALPYPFFKGNVNVHCVSYFDDDSKKSIHSDAVMLNFIQVEKSIKEKIEKFLYNQVGKKYDYLGIIDFIVPFTDNLQDQNRWFCSELISAACISAGYNIWNKFPHLLDIKDFLIPVIRHSFKTIVFKYKNDKILNREVNYGNR
jgi:hypothetical protein